MDGAAAHPSEDLPRALATATRPPFRATIDFSPPPLRPFEDGLHSSFALLAAGGFNEIRDKRRRRKTGRSWPSSAALPRYPIWAQVDKQSFTIGALDSGSGGSAVAGYVRLHPEGRPQSVIVVGHEWSRNGSIYGVPWRDTVKGRTIFGINWSLKEGMGFQL